MNLRELVELLHKLIHELEHKHHKEQIVAKGTFSVTFIVEPVTPPPLQVASPEDLGQVGGPLLITAVQISGGVPPYVVSNIQGTLPPGVSILPDGTITGTPTQDGSFLISIDVADSLG